MENVLVRIEIGVAQGLCATVVRHHRAWTEPEIQALKTGLEAEVRTDGRYPRYAVVGGQHELDAIYTALGGEPGVLVVTHPESDDELPFDIPH